MPSTWACVSRGIAGCTARRASREWPRCAASKWCRRPAPSSTVEHVQGHQPARREPIRCRSPTICARSARSPARCWRRSRSPGASLVEEVAEGVRLYVATACAPERRVRPAAAGCPPKRWRASTSARPICRRSAEHNAEVAGDRRRPPRQALALRRDAEVASLHEPRHAQPAAPGPGRGDGRFPGCRSRRQRGQASTSRWAARKCSRFE